MDTDHIGIVVLNIEDGIQQWVEVFGYTQDTEVVLNTRQKVYVVFLEKDSSIPIKLISPADKTSPVYTYARRGGGLHHLCFKCTELHAELTRLQSQGLRVLVEPQPGEAFENEDVAFVYAKHGLNIELIDTDKRACKL